MTEKISFTKKCLFDAMLELMNKEKLNEVTVSELTMTAGVSRTTFYRHYNTVEDVLLDYMRTHPFGSEDTGTYTKPLTQSPKDWLHDRVHESLTFLKENSGFMENLMDAHLEDVMIENYRTGIREVCCGKAAVLGFESDVELSGFCGMYFMICYDWIRSGFAKPVDSLCEETTEMLLHTYYDKRR